jgi:hypothetical protein
LLFNIPKIGVSRAICFCEESEDPMETFINDAMVIEGALLSFLLALCMTWLGLSGLFHVIPATMRSNPGRSPERS